MPTDLFDSAEFTDQVPPEDSVHSTPPERSYSESLSTNGKGRVRAADSKINGNRCLVENCVEEKAVDFAHCLARSYRNNSNLLDSLEWAWDLRQGTLNVDTRYNIFRLTATLHRLFDNNSWFLLPEADDINLYHNALEDLGPKKSVVRGRFPLIPNRTFKYRFVPIPGRMDNMAIIRQRTTPCPIVDDVTVHVYPFNGLPLLTTHLHPRFVICNTGQKMNNSTSPHVRRLLYQAHPTLSKVVAIYDAWIENLPDDEEDPTYDPHGGSPDDETNESVNSANHTVNTRNGLKRRRTADPKDRGSPEPRGGESSKGRKHAMYMRLSGETLQALNTVFGSEPTRSLQTTKESVNDWLTNCGKTRKEKGGWKMRRVMGMFGRKEYN